MGRVASESGCTALVARALTEAGEGGISLQQLVEMLPRYKRQYISDTLHVLLRRGVVAKPALPDGKWRVADAPQARAPDGDPEVQAFLDLAQQADRLICAAPAGLTSLQLAHQLHAPVPMIEAALAPAVERHHFVTCKVMKDGIEGIAYRISSGGTLRFDWRAQAATAWKNAREAASSKATASPVRSPRAASPPPAAEIAPSPAAPMGEDCTSSPADSADLAEPVAMRSLPVLDVPPEGLGSIETGFLCAIYSNGALMVESHGRRVTLPRAHTRRLMHYLEHMAVGNLVGEPEEARG